MNAEFFTEISFYIVAHADDWQLFMYPNVFNDLKTQSSKVVFIITTAGDAGKNEKYWLAREEGSKSSLRFCITSSDKFLETEKVKNFNGHNICCWRFGNAVFYFLRLPDGNMNGSGFSAYNFQSLSKLETSEINSIAAINNSTTYNSWQDFFLTLEKIILTESNGINKKNINYINPDTTVNTNEHADHIATGQAIQGMNIISNFYHVLYEGYNITNTADKLNPADIFWKAGMFAVYDKAVFDSSGYSTLNENVNIYLNWCLLSAKFITITPHAH